MYNLNDTIVAVSSPTSGQKVIIRMTGSRTVDVLQQVFSPSIAQDEAGLISGNVAVDAELQIGAKLYLFLAPHSYTGETLAEIHIHTNPKVAEALIGQFLSKGLRTAGPGEFTARAYLNGKIDLVQAEAVNEIIVSSNEIQLAAGEKLLAGRLAETTAKVRASIVDSLSLIEAGIDFSQEDVEFIARDKMVEKLGEIERQLEQLLAGSICCESMIDMPAVGITGAPSAGKSSLLNKLLGIERSIVSEQRRTTRDVLTGLLALSHCTSVLFDCAGLTAEPRDTLDELAQQAAIEALQNSSVVLFCVDVSKADWREDILIRRLINAKAVIPVATKADLLCEDLLAGRIGRLNNLFSGEFIATSAKTGVGIMLLREAIDRRLVEAKVGSSESTVLVSETAGDGTGLTARHRRAVTDAIESIMESIGELRAGNEEIAAMMLRAAYQAISTIEQEHIDEQVLEKIFSRFCIGK